jgi:flagellar hook-associated protein 3 FlgL
MKSTFISNLGIQNSMRNTINQAHRELSRAQKEVATGTYADIGSAIGATVANSLNYSRDIDWMQGLIDTNSIVTQRLSSSQSALESMSKNAQSALNSLILINGTSNETQLEVARRSLKDALSSFTGLANSTANGEYLFAGNNTDVKPMADYAAAGNPAKAAFDTAFSTFFGFSQSSASAANITGTQMTTFLSTVVKPMFSGTAWNTNWSSASSTNMTNRINKTDVVETSVNANSSAFQDFAYAAVIGMEMLTGNMSAEARAVVTKESTAVLGKAISEIDTARSQLGLAESRIKKSNESLTAQINIVKTNLNDLQGVDPYEASTRVNTLLQQVETSYTLTAKIQKLSLVNFL